MDVFLAFPLLLFAIALVGVIPDHAFGLTGNGLRIALLIVIIGFFSWPYIGRIVRGQTLSLREREFVDAARSLGARWPYIMFREVLPNLIAPILVYATLLIPTNILFEAALSFLGVGVSPPTPTWGGMLSDAVHYFQLAPHFMIFPGLAIFVTVLAFNLFGDGLRDALDHVVGDRWVESPSLKPRRTKGVRDEENARPRWPRACLAFWLTRGLRRKHVEYQHDGRVQRRGGEGLQSVRHEGRHAAIATPPTGTR